MPGDGLVSRSTALCAYVLCSASGICLLLSNTVNCIPVDLSNHVELRADHELTDRYLGQLAGKTQPVMKMDGILLYLLGKCCPVTVPGQPGSSIGSHLPSSYPVKAQVAITAETKDGLAAT
jgi:hypothetical protein